MSIHREISGGQIAFTRIATKAEGAPRELRLKASSSPHFKSVGERTMNSHQFTDPALVGFHKRTAKAETEAPRDLGGQAEAFAQKRRMSADARALFVTVAKHYEKTGKAIQADGFELAKLSGIPYESVKAAKQELTGWGLIVTRSDNVMGVDGLYPGAEWRDRGGRW